jgi:hypothetical protein
MCVWWCDAAALVGWCSMRRVVTQEAERAVLWMEDEE